MIVFPSFGISFAEESLTPSGRGISWRDILSWIEYRYGRPSSLLCHYCNTECQKLDWTLHLFLVNKVFVFLLITTSPLRGLFDNRVVMYRLLLLTIVLYVVDAIDVRNHIRGGIGMQDTRPQQNTLIATLTKLSSHREADKELFLEGLELSLARDGCSLSFSGSVQDQVIIKFYCEYLNNTESLLTRAPIPLLDGLNAFLLENQYVVEHKEYNVKIRKPAVWDGTEREKDKKLKDYFERLAFEGSEEGQEKKNEERRRKKLYPELHGNAVESNSPWGLDRIDTRYGALDGSYYYDYLAEDVDVYVIDTGLNVNHVEFEGRAQHLVNTAGDGINRDCNGHGTHVGSIVGGVQYGVAKGVTLYGVKALDCAGNGDSFSILTAVAAVREHKELRPSKRAIVSASLGGEYSSAINTAILSLVNDNIITVVAAGNEQSDACSFSPSSLGQNSAVIVVGASDIDDGRPIYSNYGRCVTLSAPGHGITGANFASNTTSIIHSGTSMATPHVSGVAAFVLHQDMSLTPQQVKNILVSWATPNVISGTSGLGGGKNLLYSLINLEEDPPLSLNIPQQNTDLSSSSSTSIILSINMIVFISVMGIFGLFM